MYFFEGFEQAFFEVGIYLIFVILTGSLVFYVIWYMNKRLNARLKASTAKTKVKDNGAIRAVDTPLLLEGGNANRVDKAEKEAKSSNSSKKTEDRLEKEESVNKNAHNPIKETPVLIGNQTKSTPAEDSAEYYQQTIPDQEANTDDEDIVLQNLPAAENLDEVKDEPKDQTSNKDIMNVFDIVEEDESNVADLACSMMEVDLQSIGDLGTEVLQFLGVKSTSNNKEESFDDETIMVTEAEVLYSEEEEAVYESEGKS